MTGENDPKITVADQYSPFLSPPSESGLLESCSSLEEHSSTNFSPSDSPPSLSVPTSLKSSLSLLESYSKKSCLMWDSPHSEAGIRSTLGNLTERNTC